MRAKDRCPSKYKFAKSKGKTAANEKKRRRRRRREGEKKREGDARARVICGRSREKCARRCVQCGMRERERMMIFSPLSRGGEKRGEREASEKWLEKLPARSI